MERGKLLRFSVVLIMVLGFLAQMWQLFGQFIGGLKTVAVSFEERETMEFPSFAFCDSQALRSRVMITANAAQFNTTSINVEEDIKLNAIASFNKQIDFWENTYTSELVPTMLNGYCMLYEFNRDYPVNTFASKLTRQFFSIIITKTISFQYSICLQIDHMMCLC